MQPARALSSVVLPAPVPPDTRTLSRAATAHASRATTAGGAKAAERDGPGAEAADGEAGPVDRQRRDDGVDPGPVGQAGVDQGRRAVDAQAEGRHHLLDEVLDGGRVEDDRHPLEAPAPLDPHPARAVDHDLGDVGVGQDGSRGPRPHTSASTSPHQPGLVGGRQQRALAGDQLGDPFGQPPAEPSATPGCRPSRPAADPSATQPGVRPAAFERAGTAVTPPPAAPSRAIGAPGRRGGRRRRPGRWTGRSRSRPGRARRARPRCRAG